MMTISRVVLRYSLVINGNDEKILVFSYIWWGNTISGQNPVFAVSVIFFWISLFKILYVLLPYDNWL